MYLHIFVDSVLFYNLPDGCDTVLLCVDVVGLGCHFEKSAHVHDEVSVNYCETFNIVLPNAEEAYTVKLSTFAHTLEGVIYQGEVMFAPTHEDHGLTKKLFLATQSDKHNAKICVTPFFYHNPMNMSDVMKCNDVRQAKLQKEFAFLRSRRQNWKGKRASWEADMEQLLTDDAAETEYKKSMSKSMKPDSAKPKLRRTVMGVGYAKVAWPEESPEIIRQKLLHRLSLAEERRLALRMQAKARLQAANCQHTAKTSAVQTAKQRGQASNAKLRCIIEKKENEIKYLRKLLHDAGAEKKVPPRPSCIDRKTHSSQLAAAPNSQRGTTTKTTNRTRKEAIKPNKAYKKATKPNRVKKRMVSSSKKVFSRDSGSETNDNISPARPPLESVDSTSLLQLYSRLYFITSYNIPRLTDTMENEDVQEVNLLASLLRPRSPDGPDEATEELLPEWKDTTSSEAENNVECAADIDETAHMESDNDISSEEIQLEKPAPDNMMDDIDAISHAVSTLEELDIDQTYTTKYSMQPSKVSQGNIEMQLNSLQQRLEDALKLFSTPQK